MPARTPQEVHEQFAQAFFARDLEGLLALYDEDATMMPGPGQQPVRGLAAIHKALEDLLALEPRNFRLTTVFSMEHDGLALMRSKWSFKRMGPDGAPVEISGSGTEVMRRKPDGTWVNLIDNPWGASVG